MVNRDRARSRSRHDSSDTITLPLGEEVMSLTKYGFPRRRMLPAARFRQWHFNRTPKSSKLVSPPSPCLLLPSALPSTGSWFRSSRIYMSCRNAIRRKRASHAARCGRCARNYSRIEPQAFAPCSLRIRKRLVFLSRINIELNCINLAFNFFVFIESLFLEKTTGFVSILLGGIFRRNISARKYLKYKFTGMTFRWNTHLP